MGEFACDEVGHGNQVSRGAVPPSSGLSGLNERVDTFSPTIGEFGVEAVEDALPVVLGCIPPSAPARRSRSAPLLGARASCLWAQGVALPQQR